MKLLGKVDRFPIFLLEESNLETTMQYLRAVGTVGLLIVICARIGEATDVATPGQPFVVPLAADGVQRVTVVLDSYSYAPSHLVVQARKPVELTLTSVATIIPHNFIIRDPAESLSVDQEVSPGKTVIVTFTPTRPGTFPIYCDKRLWPLPSHRDKGMEGKLEVKE